MFFKNVCWLLKFDVASLVEYFTIPLFPVSLYLREFNPKRGDSVFCEMLVSTCESTLHRNMEQRRRPHRLENLRFLTQFPYSLFLIYNRLHSPLQ